MGRNRQRIHCQLSLRLASRPSLVLNLKVEGDKVSFDESITINGDEITITYSGTLAGDELKLTRVVGQFGTEQLTAKRAGASPPK